MSLVYSRIALLSLGIGVLLLGCGSDCDSDPELPPPGVVLTDVLYQEAESLRGGITSIEIAAPGDTDTTWIFVSPLSVARDFIPIRHLLSAKHLRFIRDVAEFEIERVAVYLVRDGCIERFGFLNTRLRLSGEALAIEAGDPIRLVLEGEYHVELQSAK